MDYQIIFWLILPICIESFIELWLTARPVEPLRSFVSRRFPAFLSQLLFCGYCSSFHVAIAVAWIPPPLLPEYPILSYFLGVLILHRLSNLFHKLVK